MTYSPYTPLIRDAGWLPIDEDQLLIDVLDRCKNQLEFRSIKSVIGVVAGIKDEYVSDGLITHRVVKKRFGFRVRYHHFFKTTEKGLEYRDVLKAMSKL